MKEEEGFLVADGDNNFPFDKVFHRKINVVLEYENDWQKSSGRLEEIVGETPVEKCCA